MTNATKPVTTKEIKIPSHDGRAFGTFIAMPEDAGKDTKYPALIVIQEIFGVNQELREKCKEFASQGYITICPDLFWRIERNVQLTDSNEKELERAFELYNAFNFGDGMEDLKTTVGYAKNWEICSDKVGAIGYCLGGHLSYRLAAVCELDAAVSYYGVQIEEYLDEAENVEEPLLLHIAEEDEYVNKEAQAKILNAIEGKENITAQIYEGQDHAFARYNGMHYNEQAANLANTRTKAFFATHLS